jgi:hypothetical protein
MQLVTRSVTATMEFAGIIAVVSFAASIWLLSRPPARANLADFLDYSAPIGR